MDERGRPVVAVTGLGVITSLGRGVGANWRALTAGHSGLREISLKKPVYLFWTAERLSGYRAGHRNPLNSLLTAFHASGYIEFYIFWGGR